MHVLVFDDDERVAEIFVEVAGDCGWTAAKAASAAEFWTRFDTCRPDAIMLDLQLGDSDGMEQLRLLSRRGYTGSVVIISGFDARLLASAEEVGHSLGLAMRAVIEKPVRVARVEAILHMLEGSAVTTPRPIIDEEFAAPRLDLDELAPSMIARAIDRGETTLHLQPIVSSSDGKVTGAEGLIRWTHPIIGLIPPSQFICIAEQDASVIDRLTDWAIGTAACHHRALAARGLAVPIHVNVSGRNLHALDFPDRVAARLDGLGVPPRAIGLEITESVAMADRRIGADILIRLRLKGIDLAIDDFGTGHSTLAALRRMPFSSIKIDRGFVGDLLTSHDSFNIVRSVIGLARTMGLTSVAEGVEDRQVADCLAELGVDAMQGFCFSRALPLEAFAAWLRDRNRTQA